VSQFNRLLVAPAPGQLLAALFAATAAANDSLGILPYGREHWERVAAEIAGRLEGRRQWSDSHRGDTARVVLAWWTDQVGRRHVRVAGSNSRHLEHRFTSTVRNDSRPPLWHLYPDGLFYREKAGAGEWWAVCGCGTAGPPERIAWMGQRCRTCHDQLQENLQPDEGSSGDRFTHDPDAVSPLFSPDGMKLAAVISPAADLFFVRVHTLAARVEFDLPTMREGPQALAFSPDGALLAYTEGAQRLLVHDLLADEPDLERDVPPVRRLAFSSAGRLFAVASDGIHEFVRLRRQAWVMARHDSAVSDAAALAFAPARRRAHGGPRKLRLIEEGNPPCVLDDLVPARHFVIELAFLDEQQLICLSDPEYPTGEPAVLQIIDLGGWSAKVTRTQSLDNVYRMRLSPCGRRLVYIPFGVKMAHLLDVVTGEEILARRPNAGAARRGGGAEAGAVVAAAGVTGTVAASGTARRPRPIAPPLPIRAWGDHNESIAVL
jgi:hypothetical protein